MPSGLVLVAWYTGLHILDDGVLDARPPEVALDQLDCIVLAEMACDPTVVLGLHNRPLLSLWYVQAELVIEESVIDACDWQLAMVARL